VTERIYYHDPECFEFEAEVTGVREEGGRRAVTLDRSAFYPTSGGQPFDTGMLGDARVVEVIEADEDVIHVVEGRLHAGSRVVGRIDRARRLDHMQQHTGQHILSAAFVREHGVGTLSFHLGASQSTIDLDREVSQDEMARAESAANAVIWEDRPVSIRFASADAIDALPLRKAPKRGGTLRLIDIADFDLSACGGTHVSRTGEVGLIALREWERYKGGTRVSFVCGARALASHRELRDVVRGAMEALSVTAAEVPGAAERLTSESRDLRKALSRASEELMAFKAGALAAAARTVAGVDLIVSAVEGADAASLRVAAATLVKSPRRLVVLVNSSQPTSIVIARSGELSQDASALLRHLVSRFGGKGGGRPELAQGGGLNGDERAITEEVVLWMTARHGSA
jgi:alanyl-tRNA synthetase